MSTYAVDAGRLVGERLVETTTETLYVLGDAEHHPVGEVKVVVSVGVELVPLEVDAQGTQHRVECSAGSAVAQVVDPHVELVALVVEHRGVATRQGVLVDDHHAPAELGQVGGTGEASNPGTDHHHVGVGEVAIAVLGLAGSVDSGHGRHASTARTRQIGTKVPN